MSVDFSDDSGESSFAADDFDLSRDGCVLVYAKSIHVACGVFRYHEEQACELKRMYSKQAGMGSVLLGELEGYAKERHYSKAVLSTCRINHGEISFY